MSKSADDALLKIKEDQSELRGSIDNVKRLAAETDRLINRHRRAPEKLA